jgi:hypothetical protein
MPRWTAITENDLVQAGHAAIVAKARSLGAPEDSEGFDPVASDIADAVARVRRAAQAANALDSDATKVPASLKAVAVRMALYALMRRIGVALTQDERDAQSADNSDLLRIADRRVRVELPDDTDAADANLRPVNLGTWNSENKIVMRTHPTPTPARQFPPLTGNYANPDAPADT